MILFDEFGNPINEDHPLFVQLSGSNPLVTATRTSLIMAPAVPTDAHTVLDDCESAATWTPTASTLADDATNKVEGTNGMKITHTSASEGKATKTFDTPLVGKYLRFWAYVDPAVEVNYIVIIIWMGAVGNGNYYSLTLGRGAGRLVDGMQQVDVHLDQMAKTGTPQNETQITQIRLGVATTTGTGGAVTFDRIETVSRRPYVMFVNDKPRLEFTEDVLPLLVSRNLPCNVQFFDDDMAAYAASDSPTGLMPYRLLQQAIQDGYIVPGIHFNAQQATDALFFEYARQQLADAYGLGIWRGALHATAYQGIWTSSTRRDFVATYAQSLREGSGATQPSIEYSGLAGTHFLPPAAASDLVALPVTEFNETVTTTIAAGWLTTVIEQELGMVTFGHGSDRFQTTSRAAIAVYQAFFEQYDSVKGSLDWLDARTLQARFDGYKQRTTNNSFSY